MVNGANESTIPDSNFQFFDKLKYFDELNQRLLSAGPGTRVLLMSMSFDPSEPRIEEVMANLEQAASRGAEVTLGIDAHSFMFDKNKFGPLWLESSMPLQIVEPFKSKQDWLSRINSHQNAKAVILNKPGRRFSPWIAGRSHIKSAIIGNYSLIGGCNLDRPDDIDLMVGTNNAYLADTLYEQLHAIIQSGTAYGALQSTDRNVAINETSRLLIDAGVRNQSVIFDSSLDLIDRAQDWLVITCQFFPNARTAQHLRRASERGVKVDILFSPPAKHPGVGGFGQRINTFIERSRLPHWMFDGMLDIALPILHAKIIACDQGMIIGSHNYVAAGVKLGTAELALLSSDIALAKDARNAVLSAIRHGLPS